MCFRRRGEGPLPGGVHVQRARNIDQRLLRVERSIAVETRDERRGAHEGNIAARRKKRFRRTTDSKFAFPIADNLLERDFHVDEPNRVWVTDMTCVWTREGWLYLAAIVDLYSRTVVGWAMSSTINRKLCLDAFAMAVAARRPPPGLIHHASPSVLPSSGTDRRANTDVKECHPCQTAQRWAPCSCSCHGY